MTLLCLVFALAAQQPVQLPAPSPVLDYEFYKARVEPLFLEKRPDHARCVTCHAGSTTLRLQRLASGASAWTEAQSRQNFEAATALVVAGSPDASRLLRHPLARAAGGDVFHGGGKHWVAKTDPEWQVLAAWVRGETLAPSAGATRITRIAQTNAAGDNIHLIDPDTNMVVGVIHDIEVPHGVVGAPDGSRLDVTNKEASSDGSITYTLQSDNPARPDQIVSRNGKIIFERIYIPDDPSTPGYMILADVKKKYLRVIRQHYM